MGKKEVGILINHSIYKGIPYGKTKHEMLKYYDEAGKVYGLIPCYFRLGDVSLENNQVQAYIRDSTGYTKKRMAIPSVIHNRALFFNKSSKAKLKKIEEKGVYIFNSINRFKKWQVHQWLSKNPLISPHLPETTQASRLNIKHFMNHHDSFMMKPDSSSLGLGIVKLERKKGRWKIFMLDGQQKKSIRKVTIEKKFPSFLMKKIMRKRYLLQQTIPLATYYKRPFDFRVSVQRNESGKWQITGIVGKVAAKNMYLTNVSRGGMALPLADLLNYHPQLDKTQVRKDMERLSLIVASCLSQHIPGLADVGLDIGITAQGFPYFIECNGRDLRYSFQEANLSHCFINSYMTPMAYASSLLSAATNK